MSDLQKLALSPLLDSITTAIGLICADAANLIAYSRHKGNFGRQFGRSGYGSGVSDLSDPANLCARVHFRANGLSFCVAKLSRVPRDEGLMCRVSSVLSVKAENKKVAIAERRFIVIELRDGPGLVGLHLSDGAAEYGFRLVGGAVFGRSAPPVGPGPSFVFRVVPACDSGCRDGKDRRDERGEKQGLFEHGFPPLIRRPNDTEVENRSFLANPDFSLR